MYFLHRFNWYEWEDLENDEDAVTTKNYYDEHQEPMCQSLNTTIEEIKTVYPVIFNLFAKLIEKKYPN